MLLSLRRLGRTFATKMQAGNTKSNQESESKRLGIKKYGGEWTGYNKILVRQRGFKWRPGANVFVGHDHTLHSACEGYVYHYWDAWYRRTIVNVVPAPHPPMVHLPKKVYCYHPELFPELAAHNPPPTAYPVKQKKRFVRQKPPTYVGERLATVAYREERAELPATETPEAPAVEEVKAS